MAASTEDLFQPDGRLRLELFYDHAASGLQAALQSARQTRWESLRSPHLLMGLLREPGPALQDWGERSKTDLPQLAGQFEKMFFQQEGSADPFLLLHREFLSNNLIEMLRRAQDRAVQQGRERISSIDLLLSMLTTPNSIVAQCLEQIGASAERLAELAVMAEQHVGSG